MAILQNLYVPTWTKCACLAIRTQQNTCRWSFNLNTNAFSSLNAREFLRLLWGNTLSYHWNFSLSAWISAVFCFGSVVFTVYRVQTLGRNWRDLTRTVSWLSKMTYGVSEIRQLSTFQRMERMIVWFHAHFIFYQSTDPPYLLINRSFSIYNSQKRLTIFS